MKRGNLFLYRCLGYSNTTFDSFTVAVDGPASLRIPYPLEYKDQWVLVLGAEFRIDECWTLGVGYNYGTNPVRRGNLLPTAAVIAQHHITTGLRYEKDNWWVGGGYVLAVRNDLGGRMISDVPLGIDYGFDSELSQTQHSVFFGMGFRW